MRRREHLVGERIQLGPRWMQRVQGLDLDPQVCNSSVDVRAGELWQEEHQELANPIRRDAQVANVQPVEAEDASANTRSVEQGG
eukprot:15430806-Alexandrium_andersonii.AAC.1